MRVGDFGGFYLVKFIHLRAPYKIFGFWYLWGGFFWVIFEFLKFSKMTFLIFFNSDHSLFSKLYSFEAFLHDFLNFWFLGIFWIFFVVIFGFWKFSKITFGIRMGDFGRIYLVKFIHLGASYIIFGFCEFL